MSYHTVLKGSANDELDLLDKLHDFLVDTVGWTDHDDQRSGSGYFVATSTGEDTKQKICIKFTRNAGSHRIDVRQYLSWDNVNHTGKKQSGDNYSYIYSSGSAHNYWFYGDKDHVVVITLVGSAYYCWYGGSYDTVYNSDYATTQSSISAGDNVSVQVDTADPLEEGEYYLIMDDENCERAQISSISDTTITFTHLNNSYSSGARVGEDPMPNFISHYQFPYSSGCVQFYYNGVVGVNCTYTTARIGPTDDSNSKRYPNSKRFFWPLLLTVSNTTYQDYLGYFKHLYALDKNKQNVVSEDTIEYGGVTYDVFHIYQWAAVILPRSV
ncbi:hypothetical protein DRH14_02670 [Candidatus Shapirobacteria bacterium]|nr:MAG: hypothetical protein DRH14_02670 [Candidatus Shapirobacteria bacterium]